MDSAKLILEYIKTLIWPAILIIVLFSYEDDVVDLLKSREIDAFGLKIGQRIEDISSNYETEIADLREKIENANGVEGSNEALLSKIDSINKNVTRELSLIQQQTVEPALIEQRVVSKTFAASIHERKGFEAILKQEAQQAITEFRAATLAWPDYHNVAELEKLLQDRKDSLTSQNDWQQLNRLILQKYSWGMPEDIRLQFKRSLPLR